MVRGITFVGIPVRNQDAALKFYTETMGFKVVTDQPFTPTQRWIELGIPGSATGLALYTPEGHESRIGQFHSIAFWCDDVFATAKVLKAKGATFAQEPKNEVWGSTAISRGPGWKSVRSLQQGKAEVTINPLVRKLGIKPGMRALIVGAPPAYLKLVSPLPTDAMVTSTADGAHPFVQLFPSSLADLGKSVPSLLKHVAGGALLWIAYPKKTSGVESDLSRDSIAKAMGGTGSLPVSIIAIDEVWSALRFRPAGDVKSKRKS